MNILDKNKFYVQLKNTKKGIPIYISMPINDDSRYSINLSENRITTDKKSFVTDFSLQIIDRLKTGFEKYVCEDIEINLIDENIKSDYQLYKFINKKLEEVLGE